GPISVSATGNTGSLTLSSGLTSGVRSSTLSMDPTNGVSLTNTVGKTTVSSAGPIELSAPSVKITGNVIQTPFIITMGVSPPTAIGTNTFILDFSYIPSSTLIFKGQSSLNPAADIAIVFEKCAQIYSGSTIQV